MGAGQEPAEPAGWAAWGFCLAACFSGLRGLGGLRAAPSPTLGATASSRLPAVGAPALSSQPRSVTTHRFSWLTETSSEPLRPWVFMKMSSLLREQLPLQKTLLPTRSIPVRG